MSSVFVALVLLLSPLAAADWIVTGQETLTDTRLVLEGNLIVKPGGSLTLRNVTLRVNVRRDGEYSITAEPGATLSIYNCDIDSLDPANHFLFIINGASLVLRNSKLRGVGTGRIGFARMEDRGLSLVRAQDGLIEDNVISNKGAVGVALIHSHHITVRNNRIVNLGGGGYGVHLYGAADNLITGNTIAGQDEGILVQKSRSCRNRILNNTLIGGSLAIVVRHGAGYNLIENNRIEPGDRPTAVGLYLDKTAAANMFTGNVVRGSRIGAFVSYASDAVFANNAFSDLPTEGPPGNLGAIYLFRCERMNLLNNQIDRSTNGGITLLFSSDNVLAGNHVSDSKHGIGLWYDSDRNTIQNNILAGNATNIILEKTAGNSITANDFARSAFHAYDNGENDWNRNFWDDYAGSDRGDGVGNVPRRIPPQARDASPLVRPPRLETAAIPPVNLNVSVPEPFPGRDAPQVEGQTVWADQTMEYVWGWLNVSAGASLTLKNVTLIAASGWDEEPVIYVRPGGSLSILESKILGQERGAPLAIVVEKGARIVVKNSLFRNVGWSPWTENGILVLGDGAVIENGRFDGCFGGIFLQEGLGHRISANTVSRSQSGLLVGGGVKDSLVTGNNVTDTVNGFIPAAEPPAGGPVVATPEIESVVNAASLGPGPIAPGSLVTIFGANLGRYALAGSEASYTLGRAKVEVCGFPARLLYTSPRQINALAPTGLAGSTACPVTVTSSDASGTQSRTSAPAKVSVAPQSLALFRYRPLRSDGVILSPGFFLPVITNSRNQLLIGPDAVGAAEFVQARPGEIITLWGTGGGRTVPDVKESQNTPPTGAEMPVRPIVKIGGLPSRVLYAGLAPNYVGLYQFNVEVPRDSAPGKRPLWFGPEPEGPIYYIWIK